MADGNNAPQAEIGSGVQAMHALCLIARLHQLAADPATLLHQLGLSPNEAVDVPDLLRGARGLGLRARKVSCGVERLTLTPLPALALMRGTSVDDDGVGTPRQGLLAAVIAQSDGQRVLLQEPGVDSSGGRPTIVSIEEFAHRWTGDLILVSSRASLAGELARFDFSWFIPSLVKHRRLLHITPSVV